jgi:chorismate mutase
MKDINNPLEELRNKIDKIDKELLSLIEKRSNFAKKIIKAKDGVDIFKPRREEHLIKKLISFAQSTNPEFIENVWRLLISENLFLQGGLRVSTGPSKEVLKSANWHFGRGAKIESQASDEEAIKKLTTNDFDAAVVKQNESLQDSYQINDMLIIKLAVSPITNQKNLFKIAIYKKSD